MNRRQFIAGCSVTAAAATAGCLSAIPGFGDDIDTSSPESVVESYIEFQEEQTEDPAEAFDTLEELLHSESPQLAEIDEDFDEEFDEGDIPDSEFEVTSIEGINTVSEDVPAGQIRSMAQSEFRDEMLLEEPVIAELAEEETALVDAAYDFRSEFEFEGETEEIEDTVENRYLVAVEDDEWQIVLVQPMID